MASGSAVGHFDAGDRIMRDCAFSVTQLRPDSCMTGPMKRLREPQSHGHLAETFEPHPVPSGEPDRMQGPAKNLHREWRQKHWYDEIRENLLRHRARAQ